MPLKTALEGEGLVSQAPFRVKPRPSQPKDHVRTQCGPAMTRAGLQRLLVMLDSKVKLQDGAVTRFFEGETSMILELELDAFVPCLKS